MGIQGLLPFLKSIQRDVHVSSFRGRKVAVDSYCWLHKGAYSCALQLVMKTEKLETLPFIKYCMKRVNMLLKYDITPVMVFDGGYLPLKATTEKGRRERRQANLQKGKALLKEGRKSEAVDCFQKSVDVSPEMALALIKACRSAGVECIVAPYEADAQLAYLSKEGVVDLIITEDSDLVVFGCRKVLFKLDDSGNGKLIETDQLGKANRGLVGFTIDSFRHMCILSGCDYLASVPGIGLGKALKLMKRFNKDPYRAIKALQYETGKVPKDYETDFRRADQTFLHQVVFDPRTQEQARLNELPSDVDTSDFEFAGVPSSPRKAVGMARGNINPLNHAVMDVYSPSKAPPPKTRSWAGSVMGGSSGWGQSYPVGSRTTTTASLHPSSDSSRNHFKPPKKLKPRPVAVDYVDAVKDEDLQTMYLNASMKETKYCAAESGQGSSESPSASHASADRPEGGTEKKAQQDVVMKSRFFSSQSGAASAAAVSEETPSESDMAHKLKARRRLSLMPRDSDTLANSDLRPFPTVCPALLSTGSVPETPDKASLNHDSNDREEEEVSAEPLPRGERKRLSFPLNGESVSSRLQRFGYSKSAAKRSKCSETDANSHPLSLLDAESQRPREARATGATLSMSRSPVKNPFAKSLMMPFLKASTASRSPPDAHEESMQSGSSSEFSGSAQNEVDGLEDLTHNSINPPMAQTSSLDTDLQDTVEDMEVQILPDPPSTSTTSMLSTCTANTEPSTSSMLPTTITTNTESGRLHSFMTSEDFITTRPVLHQPPRSSTQAFASISNGSSSLLSHVTAASMQSTTAQQSCLERRTALGCQKRVSLGNSGRKKPGVKGVSRSGVNSKFKTPKRLSGSEPGLKQASLLHHVTQFAYSSRPRMSREQ